MNHSFFVILFVFMATPLFALDPYEWNSHPDDPRAYNAVGHQNLEILKASNYPALFQNLQKDLENSQLWKEAKPEQQWAYQNLLKAFQVLNGRFYHFRVDLAVADKEGSVTDDFLNNYETGFFQFPCPNGICFSGEKFEIPYDKIEKLPDPLAEELLVRIETVDHFLNEFKRVPMQKTVKAMKNAKTRWEIYMHDGMLQLPWEVAFNSLVIDADNIEYSPNRQWIILHPAMGVEISTKNLKDMTAKESLAVELCGHVWYRWEKSDNPEAGLNWWGVSAAVSLRDDLGPGIGPIFHYGKYATFGIIWHDVNHDDRWFNDAPFITMEIDLFRFAEDMAPAYQKRRIKAVDLFGN